MFSLTPVITAIYTPRPSKKDFTTVEMLRDALGVPGFLDYVIATSVFYIPRRGEGTLTPKQEPLFGIRDIPSTCATSSEQD
jgi:hypothetical protein